VVKQKRVDVMLKETHSDLRNAADWAEEWLNTSLSRGVAILFW